MPNDLLHDIYIYIYLGINVHGFFNLSYVIKNVRTLLKGISGFFVANFDRNLIDIYRNKYKYYKKFYQFATKNPNVPRN